MYINTSKALYIQNIELLCLVYSLTLCACLTIHEKSKIPFSYMLYAYSVKRAYRETKPEESFGYR